MPHNAGYNKALLIIKRVWRLNEFVNLESKQIRAIKELSAKVRRVKPFPLSFSHYHKKMRHRSYHK